MAQVPTMKNPQPPNKWKMMSLALVGFTEILAGLLLLAGGAALIFAGGSWYYILAGTGLIISGVLLYQKKPSGVQCFAAVFSITLAWTFYEARFDYWQLVPRLGIFWALAIVNALVFPFTQQETKRNEGGGVQPSTWIACALSAVFVAGIGSGFISHGTIGATGASPKNASVAPENNGNWASYGRTVDGTRYAPYDKIDRSNVAQLQVAWTFRTGDVATEGLEDQNTPIQVGDTVFVCTPRNKVFALDADTGTKKWEYDPQSDTKVWQRCRGVAYHQAPATPEAHARAGRRPENDRNHRQSVQSCPSRIILATNDARLIALDAVSGTRCRDFADDGQINLQKHLGRNDPGVYSQTSAPLIAGDLIILGGRVYDNLSTEEPSGVVRAFDARTGRLAWAWDLANPAIDLLPPDGTSYTPGTPNVWITPSYDAKLGLIYLPTGNATPDYWGGARTAASDRYSSSVVALDARTGKERWRFQTTRHDVWDYDVPSQPTLYDIPDGAGRRIPALIQTTKRGQIFLLDRRTGVPLARVADKPVPRDGAAGEKLSATQPYSVGMPAIGAEPLTEARMWGLTMFDQLACRIKFKRARYDGDFTPPTTRPAIQWPGFFGGMNWGGATINATNDYLIVNDIRLGHTTQLVSRADTDRMMEAAKGKRGGAHDGINPQRGAPYGVLLKNFSSPLGLPCQNPPFGTMTAIDLKTRKIVWQKPLGTAQDVGPFGWATHLPIPIGTPTLSGSLTTHSGLIFFTGTTDFYLRAIDIDTGNEIWKSRLPVGGQATPITYISPTTQRQFVLFTASGARGSSMRGDYVIAYALPPPR